MTNLSNCPQYRKRSLLQGPIRLKGLPRLRPSPWMDYHPPRPALPAAGLPKNTLINDGPARE